MKQPDIRYLFDRAAGLELVLCRRARLAYPVHSHASAVVLGLVLGGAVTLTTRAGTRRLSAGARFLVEPRAPHGLDARDAAVLSVCARRAAYPFGEPARRRLAALCEAAGLSESLAEAFFRRPDVSIPAQKGAPWLEAVFSALLGVPETPVSLRELAKAAHRSRFELIRRFKAVFGLTPHRFLLQSRVRGAQRLLEASAAPLADVALAAGFYDQSHFIRQFKRQVGLTPSAYRAAATPCAAD